jgi:hypothetical protein
MQVTINCCLCTNTHEANLELPEGWTHCYDSIDDDFGFCPQHAMVSDFADSQCSGCVGGWGECPMWEAFADSYRRTINDADYAAIERGVCPRRVNGTFEVSKSGIKELDISETAPTEAGIVFAKAIRDYCEKYPVQQ